MNVELLHCFGKEDIKLVNHNLDEMKENQILVKTVYTGICRCDINNYLGHEDMPFNGEIGKWGHESIGVVEKIGFNVKTKIKVGDYVATRSDPGYSNYFYSTDGEFVIIPELHPKYIIEPIACAINIIVQFMNFIEAIDKDFFSKNYFIKNESKILLIGSGMMSVIIAQYAKFKGVSLEVVGSSNKEHWDKLGIELTSASKLKEQNKRFRYIIDLSSKSEMFEIISNDLAEVGSVIALCSTPEKPYVTNFFTNSWNCHTLVFYSPRNIGFHGIMKYCVTLIEKSYLETEWIWTKGYNFKLESIKEAFEDGSNRDSNYIRGYFKF